MTPARLPHLLGQVPLIAIIRQRAAAPLESIVHALRNGGLTAIEITLPTPGSLEAVAACKKDGHGGAIGVGTICSADDARRAIDAGAAFLVTPTLDLATIDVAVKAKVPIFPGAFTPTEILTAWKAGASAVKVFPAAPLGPGFIRDLRGPLPDIPLVPTGGIDLDNLADWFDAGAVAVGIGSSLLRRDLIESGDWTALTALAARWTQRVHQCTAEHRKEPRTK